MTGSLDNGFKRELKKLIIDECGLEMDPDEIDDSEPLFGDESALGLDSLDALQISVALKKIYKIRIGDSKQLREIMVSINSLADFIQPG